MAFDFNKEVQDLGPYKLVIRTTKEGKPYALLWRGSEKLAYAEGKTKEQAYDEMLRLLGIRQIESAKAQGSAPPEAEKIADSFRYLWLHLTASQQGMLKALQRAPSHQMTVPALAQSVNFKAHGGVNLWLGLAGAMFAQECPRCDMMLNKEANPVATSWFGLWDESRKIWSMRPEVAEGMRLANCV